MNEAALKKRNPTLDVLKGITIWTVVFTHIHGIKLLPAFLSVTVFYMPFFFILSGYALYNPLQKDKNNALLYIAKKIKRLLVPALCWSLSSVVYNLVKSALNGGIDGAAVKNIFWHVYHGMTGGTIWYLWVLFALSVFIFFALRLFRERPEGHIVFFCIFCLLPKTGFAIDRLETYYPYILLGYYLNANSAVVMRLLKKMRLFFALSPVLFAISFYICFKFNIQSAVYMRDFIFSENKAELIFAFITILLGCAGVYTAAVVLKKIPRKAACFFEYCGIYSLEIYCVSQVWFRFEMVPLARGVFSNPLQSSLYAAAYSLAFSAATAAVSAFIIKKIKPCAALFFGR